MKTDTDYKKPIDYFNYIKKKIKKSPIIFPFRGVYYAVKKTQVTDGMKMIEKDTYVYPVSDFIVEPLYYELVFEKKYKPVNTLIAKIIPQNGNSVKCQLPLIPNHDQMNRILEISACVSWYGDRPQTQALIRFIKDSCVFISDKERKKLKPIPIVRQLDITGYNKEFDYFIFNDFAIDGEGKVLKPSFNNAFEFPGNQWLKPPEIAIQKPNFSLTKDKIRKIYDLIDKSWPYEKHGIITLSWIVASWFVNQIKPITTFFPFLSLFGDPGSGKTQLTRIMNSLVGFYGEEGIPLSDLNTPKGPMREIAKRSGIPTALLEAQANIKQTKILPISTLLSLYNAGNSLQLRAEFTNGLETNKIHFLGSLMFVQNIEPFHTTAQKVRVISLEHNKEEHITPETAKAFEKLSSIKPSDLAGFYIFIVKNRKLFETKWQEKFKKQKAYFFEQLKDFRIAENYALIVGIHNIICDLLNISDSIKQPMLKYSLAKLNETTIKQTSIADYFFSVLFEAKEKDLLDYEDLDVNDWFRIDENKNIMSIFLPDAERAIRLCGYDLKIYSREVLHNALRSHPSYWKEKHSTKFKKGSRKAWVFKLDKIFEKENKK